MKKEMYDIILEVMLGTFNVPVKSRTAIQKNALIQYWRHKDKFSLMEKPDGSLMLLSNGVPVGIREQD